MKFSALLFTFLVLPPINNPIAEIIKLPPGRAQKYFCKFEVAILYPLIEAPHCDAILKPIDHVEIKIYFPAHDTSAIKSLGLRRGYNRSVKDYTHLLPNLKQISEAENDENLVNMLT